jgi:hypothetical protein
MSHAHAEVARSTRSVAGNKQIRVPTAIILLALALFRKSESVGGADWLLLLSATDRLPTCTLAR